MFVAGSLFPHANGNYGIESCAPEYWRASLWQTQAQTTLYPLPGAGETIPRQSDDA